MGNTFKNSNDHLAIQIHPFNYQCHSQCIINLSQDIELDTELEILNGVVAIVDSNIVGYLLYERINSSTIKIVKMDVKFNYRSNGIGTRMFDSINAMQKRIYSDNFEIEEFIEYCLAKSVLKKN